jgi:hypothetical protein
LVGLGSPKNALAAAENQRLNLSLPAAAARPRSQSPLKIKLAEKAAAATVKKPFTKQVLDQRAFFIKLDYLPPPPWIADQKPDGTLYYLNIQTGEEMLPVKYGTSGDIHFLNMQTNAVRNSLNPDAQPVSQSVTNTNLVSTGQRQRSQSPSNIRLAAAAAARPRSQSPLKIKLAEKAAAAAAAAVEVQFTPQVLDQRAFFNKLDYLPPPPWAPREKLDGTLYYLNKTTGEEMLPIKNGTSRYIHFLNMQTNAVRDYLNPDDQLVSLSETKANLASTGQRQRSQSPSNIRLAAAAAEIVAAEIAAASQARGPPHGDAQGVLDSLPPAIHKLLNDTRRRKERQHRQQHQQHHQLFNSVPVPVPVRSNQEADSGVFTVGDIRGIAV